MRRIRPARAALLLAASFALLASLPARARRPHRLRLRVRLADDPGRGQRGRAGRHDPDHLRPAAHRGQRARLHLGRHRGHSGAEHHRPGRRRSGQPRGSGARGPRERHAGRPRSDAPQRQRRRPRRRNSEPRPPHSGPSRAAPELRDDESERRRRRRLQLRNSRATRLPGVQLHRGQHGRSDLQRHRSDPRRDRQRVSSTTTPWTEAASPTTATRPCAGSRSTVAWRATAAAAFTTGAT